MAAITVERMQVERDETYFSIDARMLLDVARPVAFRAATDYERLPEFNPAVKKSIRLSERTAGKGRLRSDMRLCAAFFCKTVRQVVAYVERPPSALDMQVVPGEGDLKSGEMVWRFEAVDGAHTRLSFSARLEPDFWVPPVIGGYLVARELQQQAETTGRAIERLAADYDISHE